MKPDVRWFCVYCMAEKVAVVRIIRAIGIHMSYSIRIDLINEIVERARVGVESKELIFGILGSTIDIHSSTSTSRSLSTSLSISASTGGPT